MPEKAWWLWASLESSLKIRVLRALPWRFWLWVAVYHWWAVLLMESSVIHMVRHIGRSWVGVGDTTVQLPGRNAGNSSKETEARQSNHAASSALQSLVLIRHPRHGAEPKFNSELGGEVYFLMFMGYKWAEGAKQYGKALMKDGVLCLCPCLQLLSDKSDTFGVMIQCMRTPFTCRYHKGPPSPFCSSLNLLNLILHVQNQLGDQSVTYMESSHWEDKGQEQRWYEACTCRYLRTEWPL